MQENLEKISKNITELNEYKIHPKVAISDEIEDYENKKVVLSFGAYNERHCEIARLQNKDAKQLTHELKKISNTFTKHFKHQNTSRIACKPVHNSGKYKPLFNRLPEDDIELLEVDYTNKGRIFGYLINNVFNVVVVKVQHLK